jgi:DNA-binding NarL/FixJ family response regulator
LNVLLVGVATGDLDRLRRLVTAVPAGATREGEPASGASNTPAVHIAGATVLDANGRVRLLDVPHDAVLLTPEAMRQMQGAHLDAAKKVLLVSPETAAEALTAREHEVLSHAADGLGNRAIGELLGISEHTVKFHLASIYGKLGVGNRTEAVQAALRRGLLEI